MSASDFEGTEVLEKLASIEKVDDFFDAIDSDDIKRAVQLLRQAKVDHDSIESVIFEWIQEET